MAENYVTKMGFASNHGGVINLYELEFVSMIDGFAEVHSIKNIDVSIPPSIIDLFVDLTEFCESVLGVSVPYVSPKSARIVWNMEADTPKSLAAKLNCSVDIDGNTFPFESALPKIDGFVLRLFDDGVRIERVSRLILQAYGDWLQSRPSQLSLLGMESSGKVVALQLRAVG
jgi:hypothetical protein